MNPALSRACHLLACPHCGDGLGTSGNTLRCPRGHSFDIARQGYVSLLTGTAPRSDTADMVAARTAFLDQGHYAPITTELARSLDTPPRDTPVVDLGAGTGHHLAGALAGHPRDALALDLSRHAARRAARAHPSITAVVCDAWRRLPVRDGVAGHVFNVFAPRNPAEIARILRPDGVLTVVTPTPGHLTEIVTALGLLTVDGDKRDRLDARLSPVLRRHDEREISFPMSLPHEGVRTLVAMGPNAWHTDPEHLDRALAALPEPLTVTAAVRVTRWSREG